MRVYDTRAQIVGVGYVQAPSILIPFERRFPRTDEAGFLEVIILWGVIRIPIILFGYVVYPIRKYRPYLYSRSHDEEPDFFCAPENAASVNAIVLEQIKTADMERELAAELRHMEMLKRAKMKRFILAMKGGGSQAAEPG
ncbi:hypothetical protein [Pelagibacterium halotolerans]|nr:hypothetical protein [Pelagibacterium halotolerans]QJR19194.1 hypothetical protein HKM20_12545 [Pelagibacterium halotolerans]SDZ99468.1 hypothetical protein SAMN05428936_101791 [Pelagibacterium halotolerans]